MQLFAISLPAPPIPNEIFAGLVTLLPKDSQDRIKRFRLPEDALRSLVGRLAPIWYLRHYSLIKPEDKPIFERGAKGKPILVEPVLSPPLAYNDSHDGSFVFLGVLRGESSEIGVDFMKLPDKPMDIQEGISEQLLPTEKQSLAVNLSDKERAKRVTTLWTLKEGYTKAIGEGIGFGLDRIRVDVEEDGDVVKVSVDDRDVRDDGWEWSTGWLDEDEGYGWAVYWRGDCEKGEKAGIIKVSWQEFLSVFDVT